MTDRKVKCLVWDLDNTVWDGVLLEGDRLHLRPGVLDTIRALDRRGILHSVASRNDPDQARLQLQQFGLWDWFLAPRIGWGPKSAAVEAIRKALNLGMEAMAFVDDQAYELAEVGFCHPQVLCLEAARVGEIPDMPEFQPLYVTAEAGRRRHLYRLDLERQAEEGRFPGPREDFLAGLGMVFTLAAASRQDLERAEELTVRTHQLNTTGQTYSLEELDAFRTSPGHLVLVAGLEDRFGPYGQIGLALVDCGSEAWTVQLLLMSCRVAGRGVGTIMLHRLMEAAFRRGLPIRAWFRPTGRNQAMLTTYRFAGFREVARQGDLQILQARPGPVPPPPHYVTLWGGVPDVRA